MPCSRAQSTTLRFCRYGEFNLVGRNVFSANGGNRALHQWNSEVGDTNLTGQTSFFASIRAAINSSTATASFGDGQWMSVRST